MTWPGGRNHAPALTSLLDDTRHRVPRDAERRCHPGLNSSGCIGDFPDFAIATFSSCGPAVDVTPPGIHIMSAVDVSSGKALGSISG